MLSFARAIQNWKKEPKDEKEERSISLEAKELTS